MSNLKHTLLFYTPEGDLFAEVKVNDDALQMISDQIPGKWTATDSGKLAFVVESPVRFNPPGIHAVGLICFKGSMIIRE